MCKGGSKNVATTSNSVTQGNPVAQNAATSIIGNSAANSPELDARAMEGARTTAPDLGVANDIATKQSQGDVMQFLNPYAKYALDYLNQDLGVNGTKLASANQAAVGGVGGDRSAVSNALNFKEDQMARGQLGSQFYKDAWGASNQSIGNLANLWNVGQSAPGKQSAQQAQIVSSLLPAIGTNTNANSNQTTTTQQDPLSAITGIGSLALGLATGGGSLPFTSGFGSKGSGGNGDSISVGGNFGNAEYLNRKSGGRIPTKAGGGDIADASLDFGNPYSLMDPSSFGDRGIRSTPNDTVDFRYPMAGSMPVPPWAGANPQAARERLIAAGEQSDNYPGAPIGPLPTVPDNWAAMVGGRPEPVSAEDGDSNPRAPGVIARGVKENGGDGSMVPGMPTAPQYQKPGRDWSDFLIKTGLGILAARGQTDSNGVPLGSLSNIGKGGLSAFEEERKGNEEGREAFKMQQGAAKANEEALHWRTTAKIAEEDNDQKAKDRALRRAETADQKAENFAIRREGIQARHSMSNVEIEGQVLRALPGYLGKDLTYQTIQDPDEKSAYEEKVKAKLRDGLLKARDEAEAPAPQPAPVNPNTPMSEVPAGTTKQFKDNGVLGSYKKIKPGPDSDKSTWAKVA